MQKEPIYIDEELCTLCGQCVEVCLGKILEQGEDIIDIAKPEWCNLCGHCVAICPVDAIRVGRDEPAPLPKEKSITPEELMYLIRSRRSIRHYQKEPVPRETIEEVMETARFAPTGANMQSVCFTVVTEPEKLNAIRDKVVVNLEGRVRLWESIAEKHEKEGAPIPEEYKTRVAVRDRYRNLVELAKSGRDTIFHGAPVLILFHGEATGVTPKDDADLQAMCMMLMAESMGLGTCLIGLLTGAVAEDESLKDFIGLPENHVLFTSMVLGYPVLKFDKAPGRKPADITWIE
jgi:nitroreductase/NAD-dependent dihydropyrimidine dehydrogenase PreA subunit